MFSVQENIKNAEPTVQLGAMCAKRVANRIISPPNAQQERRGIKVEGDESSEEEFLYYVTTKSARTETVNSISELEIYAQMLIDKMPVKFHIDCGATVNVLPSKYVNKNNLLPTKRVLQMWNKTELKADGICHMTIQNPKKRKYSVEFIVVKENLTPLLGAKVIQQMKLIEVHNENFEKVAAVTATSSTSKKTETAQEIIEVMCLKVTLKH